MGPPMSTRDIRLLGGVPVGPTLAVEPSEEAQRWARLDEQLLKVL